MHKKFVGRLKNGLVQLGWILLSVLIGAVLTPLISYVLLNLNSVAYSLPQPTLQLTLSLTPLNIITFIILGVAFFFLTRHYLVVQFGGTQDRPAHQESLSKPPDPQLESKYVELRRQHTLTLVGGPMDDVQRCLRPVDQILQTWALIPGGVLSYPRVKIGDLSVNGEYFLNHLSTGYPDLYSVMNQYQSQHNESVDKVEHVYSKVKSQLDSLKGRDVIYWENGTVWAMQAFSNEVDSQIRRKVAPQKCQIELNTIRLSGYIIARVRHPDDVNLVVSTMNSLLENQAMIGELEDIWVATQPLSQVLARVSRRLNELKANAEAGVDLRGFCEGGVEAGYESRQADPSSG